jgi:hypothetical protein
MLSYLSVKELCMKKIFLISLLFVSACILMAQQNSRGEFVTEIWQINQMQAAVIVGYQGASTQITIPDQINGYPVAGIGNNAFRSCNLESVRFPSTLMFIGEYAFYDNNISAVSLPSSVTNVGTGAFDNNAVSGNTPPRSGAATYVRTFSIEPAHGETVTVQKPAPTPQSVNIVVVPGYNPVRSSQQSATTGIVTVQDNKVIVPAPVNTAPLPVNTMPVNTSSTPTYAPAQPQGGYAQQQGYAQQPTLQVQEGYAQRSAHSNSNSLRLIPENTINMNTGVNPISEFGPAEEEPIKLYQSNVYPVWRTPPAR